MPRPTLDQISRLEFATQYQWELSIVEAPAAATFPATEDINLRCVSSDLPKAPPTPIEVRIRGHRTSRPGPVETSQPFTLVFVETVDSIISDWIDQWSTACTDIETGTHHKIDDVVATIRLLRLDREDKPIYEYIMYRCWLADYDPGGQLVEQGQDVVRPQLMLNYDKFKRSKVAG